MLGERGKGEEASVSAQVGWRKARRHGEAGLRQAREGGVKRGRRKGESLGGKAGDGEREKGRDSERYDGERERERAIAQVE